MRKFVYVPSDDEENDSSDISTSTCSHSTVSSTATSDCDSSTNSSMSTSTTESRTDTSDDSDDSDSDDSDSDDLDSGAVRRTTVTIRRSVGRGSARGRPATSCRRRRGAMQSRSSSTKVVSDKINGGVGEERRVREEREEKYRNNNERDGRQAPSAPPRPPPPPSQPRSFDQTNVARNDVIRSGTRSYETTRDLVLSRHEFTINSLVKWRNDESIVSRLVNDDILRITCALPTCDWDVIIRALRGREVSRDLLCALFIRESEFAQLNGSQRRTFLLKIHPDKVVDAGQDQTDESVRTTKLLASRLFVKIHSWYQKYRQQQQQ